jgi:hypothetical protein
VRWAPHRLPLFLPVTAQRLSNGGHDSGARVTSQTAQYAPP